MSSGSEHAAPPRRKPTSGLTILLVLLGGGFLAVLLGLVVVAVLVWHNPQGRGILGMVGETMRIMQKAQKAPGTKELRAIGCRQAMVFDMDELVRLIGQLDAGSKPPANAFGSMVLCSTAPWGTPPPCDDVASTYVRAVGARDKPFVVSVQQSGRGKASCQRLYDGAGAKLRDTEEDTSFVPQE